MLLISAIKDQTKRLKDVWFETKKRRLQTTEVMKEIAT
jgi:hypothetical protein